MPLGLRYLLGLLLFCLCFYSLSAKGEDTPQTITLGLINEFPSEFYVNVFSPTIVMERMSEHRFEIVEISHKDIRGDVDKLKPDFIVTSASDFLELANSEGAVQIGSLIRKDAPSPHNAVASTFIVRTESSIDNLWDAKGRIVAISDERSFDGWLIAQGELIALGLRPKQFFSKIIQTVNRDQDLVSLVKTGKADIGVLRTCEFENLSEVEVYIEGAGQDWKVFVNDNGPRITEEVFQSLGNIGQSSKENGLGLGLLIASDLAEANGGHLAFTRRALCGMSVVFQIAKYQIKSKRKKDKNLN